MLQRAAETVSGDDECNDPAVLLACALGSTGCPAKCAEAEKDNNDKNPNNAFNGVVAGDLSVAVSTSSNVTSIPNEGIIKVAELAVKASEDIQLQSLDITREGLSKNEGVKVWIEKDGKRISSASSFYWDSKANVTFNNWGYVVKGNETLDLIVSLEGGTKVPAGSEFQFKVSNVVSSAKNSTISPDTTALFRTAVYSTTSITIIDTSDTMNYTTSVNSPRNYNLSKDTTFSFGEFKVQNDSPAKMEKDVMIKSITFKVEGSIENLSNFKLLRDSKEVSSKYTIDGKSLTFAVNDQLDSGKSATYKVTAEPTNIESSNGDEYTLSIKKAEDVIAEEIGDNSTAYRVSVKENYYTATLAAKFSTANWDVVSLGTTKISGGNITLTRDANLASTVSADWGYSDVVVAKGNMKVNQAVKFDNMTITLDATKSVIWTYDLTDIARRAALVVDGKSYQATVNASTLKVDSEIYFAKWEHNVELQLSLVNTNDATLKAAVTKIVFKAIDYNAFGPANYTNGDETGFDPATQIAWSIRVADVNVKQKSINVKKSGPSEDVKFAAGNSDEVIVLAGEITNNEDKTLEVNKFIVKPSATPTMHYVCTNADVTASVAGCTTAGDIINAAAWSKKLWDLTVAMNNSSSSNVAIYENTSTTDGVAIDSLTTTVEPGQTVKFEIRMIPNADLVATDTFKFKVAVAGKLDGNDTVSSDLNSANVTATAGATSTVVANTTDNKLIVKPGVSTKVASFNYNVKNDSMDISTMQLVVDGFTAADIDDLTIDFWGSVGTPSLTYVDWATNFINVTFPNVVTLPVANYKVSVYATFNESAIAKHATKGTAQVQTQKQILAVGFNPQTGWATVSGTTPNKTATLVDTKTSWAAKLSFNHWVAKAYPILSVKDKNTDSSNSRLDLNIRKSNDDANTVTITAVAGNPATLWTDATTTWIVAEGSETDLTKISLDANSATVIRTRKAWASLTSVTFTVTDDEWNVAQYNTVNAWSDFASLSL